MVTGAGHWLVAGRTRNKKAGPRLADRPYFSICSTMVGARRFELPTPCTPCRCATRLRYAPTEPRIIRDGSASFALHAPVFAIGATQGAHGHPSRSMLPIIGQLRAPADGTAGSWRVRTSPAGDGFQQAPAAGRRGRGRFPAGRQRQSRSWSWPARPPWARWLRTRAGALRR